MSILTSNDPLTNALGNTCPVCGLPWSEHYQGPNCASTEPQKAPYRGSGRGALRAMALALLLITSISAPALASGVAHPRRTNADRSGFTPPRTGRPQTVSQGNGVAPTWPTPCDTGAPAETHSGGAR